MNLTPVSLCLFESLRKEFAVDPGGKNVMKRPIGAHAGRENAHLAEKAGHGIKQWRIWFGNVIGRRYPVQTSVFERHAARISFHTDDGKICTQTENLVEIKGELADRQAVDERNRVDAKATAQSNF